MAVCSKGFIFVIRFSTEVGRGRSLSMSQSGLSGLQSLRSSHDQRDPSSQRPVWNLRNFWVSQMLHLVLWIPNKSHNKGRTIRRCMTSFSETPMCLWVTYWVHVPSAFNIWSELSRAGRWMCICALSVVIQSNTFYSVGVNIGPDPNVRGCVIVVAESWRIWLSSIKLLCIRLEPSQWLCSSQKVSKDTFCFLFFPFGKSHVINH